MNAKAILLTLCACCIPYVSAQQKKVPAIKAETLVEAKVFKILGVVDQFLVTTALIKDQAALDSAKADFAKMSKKLKVEIAELQKLPVPNKKAREKLAVKMDGKEKIRDQIMMKVIRNVAGLEPRLVDGVTVLLQNLGKELESVGPVLAEYYAPDEEE